MVKAGCSSASDFSHRTDLRRDACPLVYPPVMDVLYIAASGMSDPTRASIPWHLAVNGSFAEGQITGILLAGDASEVLRADVRVRLEGVGIPPIRELMVKARDHEIPVFV